MKNNPFLNAVYAFLYIVVVVMVLYFAEKLANHVESIFQPIAMLSLFVLSASVMGYLFVFNPIRLYIDGEKDRAVKFFFKTVGTFALITLLFFLFLLISR